MFFVISSLKPLPPRPVECNAGTQAKPVKVSVIGADTADPDKGCVDTAACIATNAATEVKNVTTG